MAHAHSVNDGDKYFAIDPVTRKIENQSGKLVLIQHDHNSERFTFSIPKLVDGHDMSKCNSVKIHYLNIEFAVNEPEEDEKVKEEEIVYVPTGNVYKGIYETSDIQASPDDNDTVICSWLISRNATQYNGELNFIIRYSCVNDGVEEYGWSSDICEGVAVTSGIFNNDVIVEEYADILEKWRQELILPNIVEQYTPEEARAALGAASRTVKEATITSVWSGSSAPYTQKVTVSGISSSDRPHISPVYSSILETAIAQKEAWAMVSEAETGTNAITFKCFEEKPGAEIPIQIEVLR